MTSWTPRAYASHHVLITLVERAEHRAAVWRMVPSFVPCVLLHSNLHGQTMRRTRAFVHILPFYVRQCGAPLRLHLYRPYGTREHVAIRGQASMPVRMCQ